MTASRELDAEIAEKVMGWMWVEHSPKQQALPGFTSVVRFLADPKWVKGLGSDPSWFIVPADMTTPVAEDVDAGIPHYSTDIAAAWQVVEKMRERGLNVSITADYGWRAPWECCMYLPGAREQWPCADADTAPMAICLAARKALEGKR